MESTGKDKMKSLRLVFIIGAPGAGKGTLCDRLAQERGFTHISVGDLLRQRIADPDADELIRDYVQRGEPLPMEHLLPFLEARLKECVSGRPILLDGFPRRLEQAVGFEEVFGEPYIVVFFNCPRDLAKQRVLDRNVGRVGDTSEIFDRRYKEFIELNPDILDYYSSSRGRGKLIEVDTSGDTEVSYVNLVKALKARHEYLSLVDSQARSTSG